MIYNFRSPPDDKSDILESTANRQNLHPSRKTSQGISFLSAALVGLGIFIGLGKLNYDQDKKTITRWSELTNTLPAMIAQGHTGEARDIYISTWAEINQTLRNQRRDPITFISSKDVSLLETNLSWPALIERAKTYQLSREY